MSGIIHSEHRFIFLSGRLDLQSSKVMRVRASIHDVYDELCRI